MKLASDTSHSKKSKFIANVATLAVSLLVALLIGEVLLRLRPIPGIQHNTADYSPLVGAALTPGVVNTYRNERGACVRRRINQFGYMDKDHNPDNPSGLYRIGFFGDSYTEARQVPLEDTFFRVIERDLGPDRVECLAFGVSGFSMFQSYLTCTRWLDFFDLDLAVYVFCENDIGDQIREVHGSSNSPYPILTPTGIEVDNSFRKKNAYRDKFYFRVGNFLTSHSLVIATIWDRARLLARYGIKIRVTEADRMMAGRTANKVREDGYPRQGDPPSLWPDTLRTYAENLGKAVILKWKDDVERSGRKFAILYIPRGEIQDEKMAQDSWKPWLQGLCAAEGIPFIDTTPRLLEAMGMGKEVFFDHFTKDGHVAAADAFTTWFRSTFPDYRALTPRAHPTVENR
jgi:hypothetical protein